MVRGENRCRMRFRLERRMIKQKRLVVERRTTLAEHLDDSTAVSPLKTSFNTRHMKPSAWLPESLY